MTDRIVLNFHGKNNTPLYHLITMFAYKELTLLPNVWLKLTTLDGVIQDQARRGFIKRVETSNTGKVHYIPHHCVKKSLSTTSIKVVYDCSCCQSISDSSLNDCLLQCPDFLNNLCSILLRFRTHNFGLSTDIEKAFLHIYLHEQDRDFTRFFWLTNPTDPHSDLQVYRFKTVLFGAVSSPFILYATLYHGMTLHYPMIFNRICMLTMLFPVPKLKLKLCSSTMKPGQYYLMQVLI